MRVERKYRHGTWKMVGARALLASGSAAPMRVNTREAVQVSSLKGDQSSAQGFNPGLGNSRRCALKGHQNPARHIGSKSFACISSFSRHFQGAFLRGGYPGLKPWAELLCPFGAQTLYSSLIGASACRRVGVCKASSTASRPPGHHSRVEKQSYF